MQRADPSTAQTDVITVEDDEPTPETSQSSGDVCTVCGETPAAMHYGAIACVGCKGFFRRALMKADQLECLADGKCIVNKDMRTNCRSCRFQKCLKAGMKPAAVRPNREVSSRQKKKALAMPDESVDCTPTTSKQKDDWLKKMPVEMRTILMNLLNIEAKIMKINTLRELLEDPSKLKGKRSEMRYEPYRMAKNDELCSVAYRRVIAAIDWVENLAELVGGFQIEDKIALIKNSFAQLMVFKFATRTAEVAKDENILCLCNFCFVPRNISSAFNDSYHLGNGLVGRALDELVIPLRAYGLREEEIVCVTAMIVLNPLARDLSEDAFTKVMDVRNKIQDTLFHIVKEARLSPHPSICYGHLLLSLPIVACLASAMCENLQFAQTFSSHGEVPLLTDLFGCFPVEPFDDIFLDNLALSPSTAKPPSRRTNEKATQTEDPLARRNRKRRLEEPTSPSSFQLLRAPGTYTLTEMFDDIHREETCSPERSPFSLSSFPSTSALPSQANNRSVSRTYSLPNSVDRLSTQQSSPQQGPSGHSPYTPNYVYYPNCYNPSSWNNNGY